MTIDSIALATLATQGHVPDINAKKELFLPLPPEITSQSPSEVGDPDSVNFSSAPGPHPLLGLQDAVIEQSRIIAPTADAEKLAKDFLTSTSAKLLPGKQNSLSKEELDSLIQGLDQLEEKLSVKRGESVSIIQQSPDSLGKIFGNGDSLAINFLDKNKQVLGGIDAEVKDGKINYIQTRTAQYQQSLNEAQTEVQRAFGKHAQFVEQADWDSDHSMRELGVDIIKASGLGSQQDTFDYRFNKAGGIGTVSGLIVERCPSNLENGVGFIVYNKTFNSDTNTETGRVPLAFAQGAVSEDSICTEGKLQFTPAGIEYLRKLNANK